MVRFREGRFRSQDGLSLYYRDYGKRLSEKMPVLCLTGLARNSIDFASVAERLARERRVLCPDYRGRGSSEYDPDWRHYEPRTYILDILDLLAVTGIERVIVIGTSLGGLLAMGLAVLQPSLLEAVVLNDIGPDLVPGGLARIVDYIGTDRPQPDRESAIRFLRNLLPRLAPEADEAWWRRVAEGTYRTGADGQLHFNWDTAIAKAMRKQAELPDLWALFRALKPVPTLLLRGALSDLLAEETMRRMALEKPDLVCVTVPGRGHTPSLDEPEAERAIDAFLASL
jgi:pimeloyl-ACP methyl ester carboxylesterase